jgi:2-keto-4-pentenoate hydratase/2-oxohepta-3-ene-1,7-dioic acid hydratase in catechol pathway
VKLVSYIAGGEEGFGAVFEDGIVPMMDASGCATLVDYIASAGNRGEDHVSSSQRNRIALSSVQWLPPIPKPGKIFCVGRNFHAAITKLGLEPAQYPTLFTRNAPSVVGHLQPIVRPVVSTHYDYEGELAVIIGRPARHVNSHEALNHVAGYSCFNDGSIRDFQRHPSQHTTGKNFWRSGAFGPWMVTADEIPDPAFLKLETRINGIVVQSSGLDDMETSVAQVISYISQFALLEPGDVIAMGTPYGVALNANPPAWLEPGDEVTVTISGIGSLTNRVVDEGNISLSD